jgi:TetR/AcrR family transcriptional regulator, tetracycline repressor protein
VQPTPPVVAANQGWGPAGMQESSGSAGRGRPRAKWGTITREHLVGAAIDEIAAGRYEQLTIRSLAAQLGVAPMTLYRHVRDKEDLLGEVVDRLLADAWRPTAPTTNTWAWVIEAADRLRRFLVEQPPALRVFLSHPVTSPAAMARLTAMLDVLRAGGLEDSDARKVYLAVHTFTLGFAALEASRARWLAGHTQSEEPETDWLASITGPQQFAEGLRALIAGGAQLRAQPSS